MAEKKHKCREHDSCICNKQALEPNEDCPVHGFPFPPRCGDCGKYLKWPHTKEIK